MFVLPIVSSSIFLWGQGHKFIFSNSVLLLVFRSLRIRVSNTCFVFAVTRFKHNTLMSARSSLDAPVASIHQLPKWLISVGFLEKRGSRKTEDVIDVFSVSVSMWKEFTALPCLLFSLLAQIQIFLWGFLYAFWYTNLYVTAGLLLTILHVNVLDEQLNWLTV